MNQRALLLAALPFALAACATTGTASKKSANEGPRLVVQPAQTVNTPAASATATSPLKPAMERRLLPGRPRRQRIPQPTSWPFAVSRTSMLPRVALE